MSKAARSWTIYSIGIFTAWGIVLLIRWSLKGTSTNFRDLGLIFLGFLIGWLSATIKFILIRHDTES